MNYQVTIKKIPEMTVYYWEKRLKKYSDMMQVIPEIGEEVRKYNPDLKCCEPPYAFQESPGGAPHYHRDLFTSNINIHSIAVCFETWNNILFFMFPTVYFHVIH